MIRFMANLKAAAAIAGGVVVTAFGVYWLGRKDQESEERFFELEEYKADRKRMDDADAFYGDDPSLADRFLRERSDKRSL